MKPRNRGVAHVIAPTDFGPRFSRLPSRDGLLPLMQSEFEFPCKADPSGLRPVASFFSRGLDQLALKFCQPTKYRQHQPPMWSCSVSPSIGQRFEPCASLANRI